MVKNKNNFSVTPIKINFEIIDTSQFSANIPSRCRVAKRKNASFDDVVRELNKTCEKFGTGFKVAIVREGGNR
jgi:hypothetical protein